MEENNVPLFNFNALEVPELSIETKVNQIPKLPSIPKIEEVTQSPINIPKFNFPLFINNNSTQTKEIPKKLSLEETIKANVSNLKGNYKGEISQGDALIYNDPSLGYSSQVNNSDVYAQDTTPIIGNWYNGTARFLNETKNWTLAGFNSLPSVYDAISSGEFSKVWDNELNKSMAVSSEAMQYLYPIYKTQYAQDHPYNVFATGNLAENLSNLGMVAGTIISTIAQDLIIAGGSALLAPETVGGSLLGGAAGIGITTAKGLGQIASAYKNINSLSKIASVPSMAKGLYTAVKGGENIVDLVKNAATIKNVFDAGQFVVKTSLVASGEAGFEAMNVAQDVRKSLLQSNPNISTEEIEKTAKAAGNLTYGLNQVLLNITTPIEFGKLLSGKLTSQIFKDLPIGIIAEKADGILTGNIIANQTTESITKSFTKKYLKDLGIQMITEGGEEGGQFAIQNGITEYYKDKFNNKANSDLWAKYVGFGLKSMSTDEGLANIAGGAFIGSLTGVGGGLFADITGKTKSEMSYRNYRDQTKQYIDAFNNTNNLFSYTNKAIQPISLTDKDGNKRGLFELKNDYEDYVHEFALHGIKQGNLEARLIALDEFKQTTVEQFKKFTGIDVKDQRDIEDVVDSIKNRVKVTQDSFKQIDASFGVNPFATDNFYREAMSRLTKRTEQNEKQLNAQLWEIAKDQATKQLVNFKNKTDRDTDLSKEVKDLIPPTSHELLENFLNSPINSLSKEASTNGLMQEFVGLLESQVKENENNLKGLGKEYTDLLLEKQTIENTFKFYEKVRKNLNEGNTKEFYKDFYTHLMRIDSKDINENDFNKFVVNTTDLIKLRLGTNFLQKDILKLQSLKGQKELIKNNLDNLLFYTFVDKVEELHDKGEVKKAILVNKGEVVESTIPPISQAKTIDDVKNELDKLVLSGKLEDIIQRLQDNINGKSDSIIDGISNTDKQTLLKLYQDQLTEKTPKENTKLNQEEKDIVDEFLGTKLSNTTNSNVSESNKSKKSDIVNQDNLSKISKALGEKFSTTEIETLNTIENKIDYLFSLNIPNNIKLNLQTIFNSLSKTQIQYFIDDIITAHYEKAYKENLTKSTEIKKSFEQVKAELNKIYTNNKLNLDNIILGLENALKGIFKDKSILKDLTKDELNSLLVEFQNIKISPLAFSTTNESLNLFLEGIKDNLEFDKINIPNIEFTKEGIVETFKEFTSEVVGQLITEPNNFDTAINAIKDNFYKYLIVYTATTQKNGKDVVFGDDFFKALEKVLLTRFDEIQKAIGKLNETPIVTEQVEVKPIEKVEVSEVTIKSENGDIVATPNAAIELNEILNENNQSKVNDLTDNFKNINQKYSFETC